VYSKRVPRRSTCVTIVLDRLAAKSSEPRSTCTSSVLTQSTRSLPCTLALVDVLDVSHRGWSPGLLAPQSKPHVRPSPLIVHRYGTSLLDLHPAVDHHLRAPYLHNTSQETCRTHSFRHGRVSHHSTFFVDNLDNHSSQNKTQGHILTLCSQSMLSDSRRTNNR
jgi:hypothetical protein